MAITKHGEVEPKYKSGDTVYFSRWCYETNKKVLDKSVVSSIDEDYAEEQECIFYFLEAWGDNYDDSVPETSLFMSPEEWQKAQHERIDIMYTEFKIKEGLGVGRMMVSEKIIYEISNPSDAYTLVASDIGVGAIVCFILGSGNYGLHTKDRDEELDVPIFLFAKEEQIEEWFKGKTGLSITDFLEANKDAVIECLESVLIGSFRDRELFTSAVDKMDDVEKKKQFQAEWHDKKRSSMNDIGGDAQKYAEHLRKNK